MLKNIISITLRNFSKNKKYTLINLLGLSTGICVSLIIFVYVQYETSYDNFYDKSGRIYRVESYTKYNGNASHWAATPGSFLSTMATIFPEIEHSVKIIPQRNPLLFRRGDEWFGEKQIIYADSSFLKMFNLNFVAGDAEQLLSDPLSVIITEKIANKYFGDAEPMGRQLHTEEKSYTVTGIIRDVPENSHFHFDMIIPLNTLRPSERIDGNAAWALYTYILLHEKTDKNEFFEKAKVNAHRVWGYGDPATGNEPIPEGMEFDLKLNALEDIHLHGHAEKEIEANGSIQSVYIFSTVAILILLIASINYMNLATARSSKRTKEIGLRKVMGAYRYQIYAQFFTESIFMTLLSTIIAIIAAFFILPIFNETMGSTLTLDLLNNPPLLYLLLLIVMVIGIISGSYPAIYLSSVKSIDSLKTQSQAGSNNSGSLLFRRVLVVLQFSISIILLIGATTIYRQLNLIHNKNLGFNKEQVLVVQLPGRGSVKNLDVIRTELKKINGVEHASGSASIPGIRVPKMPVRIPDLIAENNGNEEEDDGVRVLRIIGSDEEIVETLGLEIVEGRDLSEEYATDASGGFLLNEAAIKHYGLEDSPIGRPFEYIYALDTPKAGAIIGVIKDFHYASLHNEVEPLMIMVFPDLVNYLSIRMNSNDIQAVTDRIATKWKVLLPNVPFDYFFLDENYDQMYKSEMNLSKVFLWFTALAIGIACLGLYGLVSFVTEQKTKEIGLRKVLGASVPSILRLISKEFVMLVLIAFAIASYPSYYVLNNWLNQFAFKVELGFMVFFISLLATLIIALTTVISQSISAANKNPTVALRHD